MQKERPPYADHLGFVIETLHSGGIVPIVYQGRNYEIRVAATPQIADPMTNSILPSKKQEDIYMNLFGTDIGGFMAAFSIKGKQIKTVESRYKGVSKPDKDANSRRGQLLDLLYETGRLEDMFSMGPTEVRVLIEEKELGQKYTGKGSLLLRSDLDALRRTLKTTCQKKSDAAGEKRIA